ncbi:Uncharacterised protein [Mycobacteroides abscessus subsp. abscessus]|nr:Uncharacterised protein [Mycobacteroides abscessus subsp. abscessus]
MPLAASPSLWSEAASLSNRRARESVSMNSMRACGYAGSIGTHAAPHRVTAHTARTHSAPRGSAMATKSSGPTPLSRRRCARSSASESSWR